MYVIAKSIQLFAKQIQNMLELPYCFQTLQQMMNRVLNELVPWARLLVNGLKNGKYYMRSIQLNLHQLKNEN